ncbi:MAG: replication-associated recombination protein A [Lachnospiraceae bacterium]|nr:replication-associated recombination protein A [Lachnospiraceae bacterium]
MEQISLFDNTMPEPLAEKLRPRSLEEYAGQEHLLGPGKALRRLIESDNINSMILWGPPGVGKTTLAKIIAGRTKADFITFSAVTSGIKEIKQVMEDADKNRKTGKLTILFVDEIHRFNRAQQDAFLPYVEKGSITLIGATTENPSFEINGALLSRCHVFVLHELSADDMYKLLKRAVTDKRGFGNQNVKISDDLLEKTAAFADGDARRALSTLEMLVLNGDIESDGSISVSDETFEQCTSKKSLLYDKKGEGHYNLISALHKSMRNSDADASVYWLARMLEAGEDPIYIARRVTRFAAEDVGLADPEALKLAVSAFEACRLIGMPECSVHLTEAVIYMALAPKSNAMEKAYMEAAEDVKRLPNAPVPLHIRNGETELMRDNDYGKGYMYAHDYADGVTAMQCLPDELKDTEYYHPVKRGSEKDFGKRYLEIKKWKKENPLV